MSWRGILALGALLLPAPAVDPRPELLALINQERARAGARPLVLSETLNQVAQARAEEVGRRGSLPGERESGRLLAEVDRRLRQAGYTPHGWSESLTAADGELAAMVAYWKEGDSFRDAMSADYREIGIGLGELAGVPLYSFLIAWPESDYFARQTASIAQLDEVRRGILDAVNAARREKRLRPLVLEPRLAVAAQRHAEAMRDRGFYSHDTPEGLTARDRILAAGYPARVVGENIAEGQFTVAEVMNGWLNSPAHRRNILEPSFTQLGVGLAIGRFDARYRLVWVQDFGAPGNTLQFP
jgi:uncharacterized protein YkwD